MSATNNNNYYYSFKIFLRFWLAKSIRIIHHNQLLLTKFERILRLINRWHQKCSTVAGQCTVNWEDLGTRLSCFGCEKINVRTVGGTFYSFHDELSSKNISRRQLERQHLLFGVHLQTWTALYLLNINAQSRLDLLTSRAFECVARSCRVLPHQTRKPSERLWESLNRGELNIDEGKHVLACF